MAKEARADPSLEADPVIVAPSGEYGITTSSTYMSDTEQADDAACVKAASERL